MERGPTHVVVEVAPGRRERIESADTVVVQTVDEVVRPVDPSSRYLEAPSAFLPSRGDILLSDTQLAHLTGTWGAASWLVLSVGSALPVLHASPYDANVQASLRAGLPLHRLVRVAWGLHLTTSSSGRSALYASATATVGTDRAHLSLHAGPAFPGSSRLGRFGDTGLAVAGNLALPYDFAVLAEAWASRALGRTDLMWIGAGRVRVGRAALDLGIGSARSRSLPFPWVGLTLDATP